MAGDLSYLMTGVSAGGHDTILSVNTCWRNHFFVENGGQTHVECVEWLGPDAGGKREVFL